MGVRPPPVMLARRSGSAGCYSVRSARQTVWRETPKVLATEDWDWPLRRSRRMAAVWSGVNFSPPQSGGSQRAGPSYHTARLRPSSPCT